MQVRQCDKLQKILFIDDDPDILSLVQMTLETIGGFEVHTCTSARKGMALAEACHPDLILLDVMMPDIDGPSLMGKIRSNKFIGSTPVVFMTARVQPAEMDKYVALGAAGVIPKPFNPVTLPDEVQELWHGYQCSVCGNMADYVADLKQHYINNLPAKREQIEAFIKKLKAGKSPAVLRRDIEHVVHNLAGSGTTYGYQTISKSARLLEEMLSSAPDSPKLSSVAEKLVEGINRVIAER